MSPKRSGLSTLTLTTLRRTTGRYASKFTPGGREKRMTRPIPSMPKFRCLEGGEFKEESLGPEGTRISHHGPK